MAWNPSLHPRGPDGRFTKSFARKADFKKKKQIAAARAKFKARPRFKTPNDASGWLGAHSAQKPQPPGQMDRMLAQLQAANKALRSGKPDQSGFGSLMSPTKEDVTVYRSVPLSEFGDASPGDLKGFTVKDAGYFPTSLAPMTPAPGEARMEIDVPAGTEAVASPDTSELVLDAGMEMSVDEVTTNPDGSAIMRLTVLPADTAPTEADRPTEPSTSDFADRVANARTGRDALGATPGSMVGDRNYLSSSQNRAFGGYRASDYGGINSRLRNGGIEGDDNVSDRFRRAVAAMDSAFRRNRLEADVATWRGLDGRQLFGDRLDGDLTGTEWREDAYVSTTTDGAIADTFAEGSPDAIRMRILTPAGTGAIELSDDSYESELLLQRGLTMRVVADHGVDAKGIRQIDVEVLPVEES